MRFNIVALTLTLVIFLQGIWGFNETESSPKDVVLNSISNASETSIAPTSQTLSSNQTSETFTMLKKHLSVTNRNNSALESKTSLPQDSSDLKPQKNVEEKSVPIPISEISSSDLSERGAHQIKKQSKSNQTKNAPFEVHPRVEGVISKLVNESQPLAFPSNGAEKTVETPTSQVNPKAKASSEVTSPGDKQQEAEQSAKPSLASENEVSRPTVPKINVPRVPELSQGQAVPRAATNALEGSVQNKRVEVETPTSSEIKGSATTLNSAVKAETSPIAEIKKVDTSPNAEILKVESSPNSAVKAEISPSIVAKAETFPNAETKKAETTPNTEPMVETPSSTVGEIKKVETTPNTEAKVEISPLAEIKKVETTPNSETVEKVEASPSSEIKKLETEGGTSTNEVTKKSETHSEAKATSEINGESQRGEDVKKAHSSSDTKLANEAENSQDDEPKVKPPSSEGEVEGHSRLPRFRSRSRSENEDSEEPRRRPRSSSLRKSQTEDNSEEESGSRRRRRTPRTDANEDSEAGARPRRRYSRKREDESDTEGGDATESPRRHRTRRSRTSLDGSTETSDQPKQDVSTDEIKEAKLAPSSEDKPAVDSKEPVNPQPERSTIEKTIVEDSTSGTKVPVEPDSRNSSWTIKLGVLLSPCVFIPFALVIHWHRKRKALEIALREEQTAQLNKMALVGAI